MAVEVLSLAEDLDLERVLQKLLEVEQRVHEREQLDTVPSFWGAHEKS